MRTWTLLTSLPEKEKNDNKRNFIVQIFFIRNKTKESIETIFEGCFFLEVLGAVEKSSVS